MERPGEKLSEDQEAGGLVCSWRPMPSLRSLLLLFDKHANGDLSDYEVSAHLHDFDGAGVLQVAEDSRVASTGGEREGEGEGEGDGEGEGGEGGEGEGGAAAAAAADCIHERPAEREGMGREGKACGAGDSAASADARSAAGKARGDAVGAVVAAAAADVEVIPDSEEDVADEASDGAGTSTGADACKGSTGGHEMTVTRDIDTTFPPPSADGRFSPSPFQKALLGHVARVRDHVGHRTGLLVMATALGKTVFCILDIQRQFLGESGDVRPRARDQMLHVVSSAKRCACVCV